MGRLLVVVGLALAAAGLLVMAGFPLFRLPGDVVFRRGTTTVYVPIGTSVVVSVLLSVLLMLLRR